ncbi:hypothetical protein ARMGADRAFT_1167320 [Armillaria gallica]|uniref:Uncharacterized protein n=1 Tax=Armillaria gallica TaxID=47427 RepID=A0A2H3DMQ1_ARMGA|nr:hypothetical protein ARMGADRAFT_1167320 [Armillaria gallica]
MPATAFQMARLLSRPPKIKQPKGSIERLTAARKREIAGCKKDNPELREKINAQQNRIYRSRMAEEKLIFDSASRLHRIARLRETESVNMSLDIIDISSKVYGTPLEAYSYSRNKVISIVDPTLQEDEVDQAGRCLYSSCRLLYKGCTSPIVLKEGELPPPSVAAFFALAHFCDRANVRVEYRSKSGSVLLRGPYISSTIGKSLQGLF